MASNLIKKFHIPSRWLSSCAMVDQSTTSIDIATMFDSTIYKNTDNNQMLHDYLHFLLMDMLAHNKIPFIEEKELKQGTEFFKYLKCTPDLLIKGKILLDVYIGYDDMSKKIEKYKELKLLFEHIYILNQRNIVEICLKINLSQEDADYINESFNIFKSEYTHWMSCLKIGKILRNETYNCTPIVFNSEPEFEITRHDFKDAVLRKLQNVSTDDT